LNIRRIIFTSLIKFKNNVEHHLTRQEIKQIGGRAGRARSIGYITAFNKKDLDYIRTCFDQKETESILKEVIPKSRELSETRIDECYHFKDLECDTTRASFFPTLSVFTDFANVLTKINDKDFNIKELLTNFSNYCQIGCLYELKDLTILLKIADLLGDFPGADLSIQYNFLMAPLKLSKTSEIFFKAIYSEFLNKRLVPIPQYLFVDMVKLQKEFTWMKLITYLEELYNCKYSYFMIIRFRGLHISEF
jgi:hypothetical protein